MLWMLFISSKMEDGGGGGGGDGGLGGGGGGLVNTLSGWWKIHCTAQMSLDLSHRPLIFMHHVC